MTLADPYTANAEAMIGRFMALRTEEVLAPVLECLPPPPVRVLDIGAGPGRDAAWFAGRGDAVTAVEPVAAFRAHGAVLGAATWLDDSLPDLAGLPEGAAFDLILGVGVWHHLRPGARDRAMARLAALLAPDGRLILSLRQGPNPETGGVWPVPPDPEVRRAEGAGLVLRALRHEQAVQPGNRRAGVSFIWTILSKDDDNAE